MGLDDDDPEGDALFSYDGSVEGHRRPRFGARWERADPAAVFDALPVRPSRRTLEAAVAADLLVRRFLAMSLCLSGLERRCGRRTSR